MIEVPHYGVHWAEGVAFLIQGERNENALGLNLGDPFEVVTRKRNARCNHRIPLVHPEIAPEHLERFEVLRSDPLVEAMLPLPRRDGQRLFYLSGTDPGDKVRLSILSKMSSPIRSIVVPLWTLRDVNLIDEMTLTNVQPLVVTDVGLENRYQLTQLCQLSVTAVRTTVLVGTPHMVPRPEMIPINTGLREYDFADLAFLPWESYGSHVLKQYMLSGGQ